MAESEPKTLPKFASLDEMVEFFDTQDLGDYLDSMPEVEFEINLKRRRLQFELDTELANKVTKIAKSKQMSSEELIETWVRERVLAEA
jgi:predicted DNA binding CopG/RHH family protein